MSKLRNPFGGQPIIALDFDAVLHKYKGWNEGKLNGPIDGALDAVKDLERRGFRVVVHSTRGEDQIRGWLTANNFPPLEICSEKPPAVCLVDDRAVTFLGGWNRELIDTISKFRAYWEPEKRVL